MACIPYDWDDNRLRGPRCVVASGCIFRRVDEKFLETFTQAGESLWALGNAGLDQTRTEVRLVISHVDSLWKLRRGQEDSWAIK